MADRKTLIFGTYYAADQQARYVATLWARLLRRHNPHADLLLIDSASPVPPPEDVPSIDLGDNIGHLSRGGRDGWGRAFCRGIEAAIEGGYEYAVAVEADLLYAGAVAPVLDRMYWHLVKIAAPLDLSSLLLETGLMFMDVGWLRSSDFVAQYDWPLSTLAEFPERKVERIAGDKLFCLPIRGLRNDVGHANPATVHLLDYITHADVATYKAFAQAKGAAE